MSRSLPLALAALMMTAAAAAGTVTPAQVAQQIRDPKTAPFLLDVRTAEEFAEGHVPGATNIPVGELEAHLAEVPKDRPVVVYCRVGGRAALASSRLRERGYTNVSEMQGSMTAWEAARLPVER
jgi:rhodanese-related sulfurtransferase